MSSISGDAAKRLAIGLDFDGVIHAYGKGYFDGTCYDVPVDGAFDAIRALMVRYNVFVFTTRKPEDVKEWFDIMMRGTNWPFFVEIVPDGSGPFWDKPGVLGVTNRKLAAIAYVDDRAVRFTTWKDVRNHFT
jgi:hypothetical protein